ncbi:MAG: acyl-CoA dehydrogenase [Deltaproteobacteria bacterium]|nr:acyl-CoA dehydrogenase [Deltaproteobacteria bacterium]MBW2179611.1 acyl-CoA dehydrogenase [Deltaproteobacteria bacterium]MBW2364241.1 acyl-CoA dehydrogenase [Deltaproteobacteria bacterium]
MIILNPKKKKYEHLDEQSREIMLKTIDFFENKGKIKLKEDFHERVWYSDFLEFVKKEKIFSTLLTPAKYGNGNTRWDTFRNCEFNDILGFYGLCYWYTWQVTILGLGPIWMSDNEEIKKKTAKLLEDGGIFAFGLSEKEHGADLYSSDMALTPLGDGKYVADGGKYYIGNANKAGLVSTFGKNSETGDYVFFAVDSQHENYECIKNVCASQNYVAQYALNGYPITEADILSQGREAWDTSLNTINVGKFNLGWASIGICSHAFYEAMDHAANRNLFGKYVTEFTHIRQLFVDAYTRLVAMKLFAYRNSDYMRSASAEDRRYLLYNPMTKMKVTTQGEEVINLLWDVIAAKGFEKDMFFEMAAQDIRALPKLEGTVHVNMALIIKFMPNYFFNPDEFPEISKMDGLDNDDFLFNQGPTKGLGKIQFHDYNIAYNSIDLPNINILKEQIEVFKELLLKAPPDEEQQKDIDFLLILGELFTLVAYGQLIIENAKFYNIEDDLLDQIFDFIVRDFSKFALQLYSKTVSADTQMELCMKMIKKPKVNKDRYNRVWEKYVYTLKGEYEMSP